MVELKLVGTDRAPLAGAADTAESLPALTESLSALIDGEAGELELRRVLRQLDREAREDGEGADTLSGDGVRATWHRLHVARRALHSEETFVSASLLAGVRAAIDADPAHSPAATGGWRRAVGSFAVAASVAAVVLVGGQQLAMTAGDNAQPGARVAPLPVGVVNTVGAVPVQASYGTRDVPTLRPADRNAYRDLARLRLRRYSQEHADHASLNTPQGMLPFARVPVIEQQ